MKNENFLTALLMAFETLLSTWTSVEAMEGAERPLNVMSQVNKGPCLRDQDAIHDTELTQDCAHLHHILLLRTGEDTQ